MRHLPRSQRTEQNYSSTRNYLGIFFWDADFKKKMETSSQVRQSFCIQETFLCPRKKKDFIAWILLPHYFFGGGGGGRGRGAKRILKIAFLPPIPFVQKVDSIIYWLAQYVLEEVIAWIGIYPLGSTSQALNNLDLVYKYNVEGILFSLGDPQTYQWPAPLTGSFLWTLRY